MLVAGSTARMPIKCLLAAVEGGSLPIQMQWQRVALQSLCTLARMLSIILKGAGKLRMTAHLLEIASAIAKFVHTLTVLGFRDMCSAFALTLRYIRFGLPAAGYS